MTDLERRVLDAAVAYAQANDAYHRACREYRTFTGRQDLEQRTDREHRRWRAHVVPLMEALWPLTRNLEELGRDLGLERASIAQEQTL